MNVITVVFSVKFRHCNLNVAFDVQYKISIKEKHLRAKFEHNKLNIKYKKVTWKK